MDDSFALSLFKDMMNNDISEGVYQVLLYTPQKFANGVPWGYVKNVYDNAILPVGLMVIVVFFMIGLIEKLSSEHFNWDQLAKAFGVFVGSWYLIQNAFPIMEGLFQIGANLLAALGGNVSSGHTVNKATQIALWKELTGNDNLKDIGMIDNLFLGLKMFPYWLFNIILGFCAKIICWSRLIELFLRTMYAPIALSDCFHRGLEGSGARFLKNYFALSLQGGVIYAIISLYGVISASVISTSGFWSFVGTSLILGCAAVGLLFKSISFSKELVGTA